MSQYTQEIEDALHRGDAQLRLEAAAPDLLEALKDLLGDAPLIRETNNPTRGYFECRCCGREYGAGMDESSDDCADGTIEDGACPGMVARAAIAKAEGR